MSTSPEHSALPLIVVHSEAAAGAEPLMAARLEAAGVSPGGAGRRWTGVNKPSASGVKG